MLRRLLLVGLSVAGSCEPRRGEGTRSATGIAFYDGRVPF